MSARLWPRALVAAGAWPSALKCKLSYEHRAGQARSILGSRASALEKLGDEDLKPPLVQEALRSAPGAIIESFGPAHPIPQERAAASTHTRIAAYWPFRPRMI